MTKRREPLCARTASVAVSVTALSCAAAFMTGALEMAHAQAPVVAAAPPGVESAQRAWQNWTLNCQGCHRPDGSGSANTAPSLAGTVARFLSVPGGREYLGRVPGVATSPLSNAELAEVVNWMLWRFDSEHLRDFRPYTADEIGSLRTQPLRLEAGPLREALLKKADEQAAAGE